MPLMTDAPRLPTEAEEDKSRAEAEKARAEAAAATALAEKHRMEARVAKAEARETELRLVKGKHEADREDEKRREELAAHKYHHVYLFNGSVSDDSAKKCMDQLTLWNRNEPGCEIEIIFNSPGGSVIAGLALWDHIQFVRAAGHHVTTSTVGYAASMAGILLRAGDKRIMGRQSWLMIHEASFGAQGKIGEVEDTVNWVKMVQGRILDIFASRCQATDAPKKLTRRQIENRWRRQDWWVSSDDALAFGLVDELR